MAGYEVPTNEATIVLEEAPYQGAEITVDLAISWGTLQRVRRFLGQGEDDAEADTNAEADEAIGIFAKHLVRWNLRKGGKPIPATEDGVRSIDMGLLGTLIGTWARAIGGVPAPLVQPSSAGGQSGQPEGRSRRRSRKRSSSTTS